MTLNEDKLNLIGKIELRIFEENKKIGFIKSEIMHLKNVINSENQGVFAKNNGILEKAPLILLKVKDLDKNLFKKHKIFDELKIFNFKEKLEQIENWDKLIESSINKLIIISSQLEKESKIEELFITKIQNINNQIKLILEILDKLIEYIKNLTDNLNNIESDFNEVQNNHLLNKGENNIKEGVDFVFEQCPELYNIAYEGLGFNKTKNPYLENSPSYNNYNRAVNFSKKLIKPELIFLLQFLAKSSSNRIISDYGNHKKFIEDLYNCFKDTKEKEIHDTIKFVKDTISQNESQLNEAKNYFNYKLNNEPKNLINDDLYLYVRNVVSKGGIGELDKLHAELLRKTIEKLKNMFGYSDEIYDEYKNYEFFKEKINIELTPQQKQQAKQLYSKYLDTIFPEIKPIILFKGLRNKSKKVHNTPNHSFYTNNYLLAYKFYRNDEGIKIFLPKIKSYSLFKPVENKKLSLIQKDEENFINNSDKDCIILQRKDIGGLQKQYVIKKNIELHELGSKQDIEMFKKFIKK
jgi:hypothetical protein